MKRLKYITVTSTIILFLTGCIKQEFYPDPDDPGLSRFTSKKYQTGTCYINEEPYINYWPKAGGIGFGSLPFPTITKVLSGSTADSLDFSWPIGINEGNKFINGKYSQISIRLPVSQAFSRRDLAAWDGKRFGADVATLYLDHHLKGTANIYFVKISSGTTENDAWRMTGLFDGNIGDSIIVKKGRFDYYVELEGF
jgi:hypothetical protein